MNKLLRISHPRVLLSEIRHASVLLAGIQKNRFPPQARGNNILSHDFFRALLFLISVTLLSCDSADFYDVNEQPGHFADYRGKWIVLSYWAEWCAPCLDEIPELNRFYQAHKDQDAVVLGISFDPLDPAKLKTLINQYQISYPVLQDNPGTLLGITEPSALPFTYLINPQGQVARELKGPQTQASLEALIQSEKDG